MRSDLSATCAKFLQARLFGKQRRHRRNAPANVQFLERRMCLSGISFTFANDTLSIRGDEFDNNIFVGAGSTIQLMADGFTMDTGVNPAEVERIVAYGGDGHDRIEVDSQLAVPARLLGQNGDDLLIGSSENDSLYGDSGADTLIGNGGNDFLSGGPGVNQLQGGPGDDRLMADSQDNLAGGSGRDRLYGQRATAGLSVDLGSSQLEIAYGSPFDDVFDASTLSERAILLGFAGNDTLIGSPFNDYLRGQDGDDNLQGGAGNDGLDGSDGADQLFGEGDNDNLIFDADDIVVSGGDGVDRANARRATAGVVLNMGAAEIEYAYGSPFADKIDGSESPVRVTIHGDAGNDTLIGSPFNDYLRGQDGDDNLQGGAGNDGLDGSDGADQLFGEGDNDNLIFDADDIVVSGGDGVDRANARRATAGVVLNMGAAEIEYAYGSPFADKIDGSESPVRVTIHGDAGNDTLIGSPFNDYLRGQDGDDNLQGGAGNDNLTGDAGADSLRGQDGNDFMRVDGDDLEINAGPGVDRVDARSSATPLNFDLDGADAETYFTSQLGDTVFSQVATQTTRIHASHPDTNIRVAPSRTGNTVSVTATTTAQLTVIDPVDGDSTIIQRTATSGRVETTNGYGRINFRNVAAALTDATLRPAFRLSSTFNDLELSNDELEDGVIAFPDLQLNGGGIVVGIHNDSSEDLVIDHIDATGDFRVTLGKSSFENGGGDPLFPLTIPAGDGFGFRLSHRNPQPGTARGSLIIQSDDATLPQLVVPVRGEVLYEPNVHILAGATGWDIGNTSQVIDFGTFPAGETAFVPMSVFNYEFQVVSINPSELASSADFYFPAREFEDGGGGQHSPIPANFEFRLADALGLDSTASRYFAEFVVGIDEAASADSPGLIRINRSEGKPLEFLYTIEFTDDHPISIVDTARDVEIRDDSTTYSFGTLAVDPAIDVDKTRTLAITNASSEHQTITLVSAVGDFQVSVPPLSIEGIVLAPGEVFEFDLIAIPGLANTLTGQVVVHVDGQEHYDFTVGAELAAVSPFVTWISSDHDHIASHQVESSLSGGDPVVRTELSPNANTWHLSLRSLITNRPLALRYQSNIPELTFTSASSVIEPGGAQFITFEFPRTENRLIGWVEISAADGSILPLRIDLDLSFRSKGGFE